MENCIFCAIANKEMHSHIVYENDNAMAFLDISPVNPGHTVVIPKKHYDNFDDTPLDEINSVMAAIKKISSALQKMDGVIGINIHHNNKRGAGQVVMHTHFHVIPRYKDDGLELWHGNSYDEGEMEFVAAKIRESL